jgi:hypothetical protein
MSKRRGTSAAKSKVAQPPSKKAKKVDELGDEHELIEFVDGPKERCGLKQPQDNLFFKCCHDRTCDEN